MRLVKIVLIGLLYCAPLLAEEATMPDCLVNLGKGPFFSNYAFVVDKSQRTLAIWEQKENGNSYEKIKEFNADFGKMMGDKASVGDYRTPEGIYFFERYLDGVKLNFQEYGQHNVQAYPMNYPNLFDQRNGKTGSGIWLHTLPDEAPLTRGSRGCVVLRTNDFSEAAKFIKINNTPILVEDHVNYVDPKNMGSQREAITAWLKKWMQAWQTKDISNYMSFYDQSFHSKGMNFKQWERYKKGLTENYKSISVAISEPRVMHFRNEWMIQFIQKYQSDLYQDMGYKTLYLKGDIDNFKIIAEDFENTDSQIATTQFAAGNFSCCSEAPASVTEERKVSTSN